MTGLFKRLKRLLLPSRLTAKVDQEALKRLWVMLREHYPVLDTRSENNISIRIYSLKSGAELLMAFPMALAEHLRSIEPQPLTPDMVRALAEQLPVLTPLPDGRLVWVETYTHKREALAQAIHWCEALGVEEAAFKSMRVLLSRVE